MRAKSSKNVVNQKIAVHFYLAEDLRQEANGKVSAIGLYTDHVVVVGMPESAPEPTEKDPILLRSLGFLFNISGFTKPTSIGISRSSKAGLRPLVMPKEYPAPGEGRSINLLALLEPCAISELGKKKMVVSVGESNYEFEYEIRRGPLPNTQVDAVSQTAPEITKASRARAAAPRKR